MLGICKPDALLFDPPPVIREEKLFAAPVKRELLPEERSLPLREGGDAGLVEEELPMVYLYDASVVRRTPKTISMTAGQRVSKKYAICRSPICIKSIIINITEIFF